MNSKAANRERRIFDEFIKVTPIPAFEDRVESRPPPEPDILCPFRNGETVAFELVELIDEGYARATSDQFRTKAMLDELPSRLPADLRSALSKILPEGGLISFDFSNNLAVRDRETASLEALRWIVDRGYTDGHVSPDSDLRSRISTIHVHPWKWGLMFDAGLFVRLTDPTLARLESKFRKSYKSEHAVELLMYTEIDLLYPDDVWRPAIDPYVQAHLSQSAFRRVWLFKAGRGAIDYVFPPIR